MNPASFLRDFTSGLAAIFGAEFGGLYLHGSIALNAFDPASSDIDFVVLLHSPLQKDRIDDVRQLHRRLRRESHWGKRLDGYYLFDSDRTGLNGTPQSFQERYLYVLNGRVQKHSPLPAAARYLLHRNGVTLAGKNPREIFADVPAEELHAEMRYNLEVYWPGRLRRPWRFLFTHMVDFAVTTLPRILFTLETGIIISKSEALLFIEERFPEWKPLVDDVRSGRGAKPTPLRRIQRMRMTMRFVRKMIEEGSQKFEV